MFVFHVDHPPKPLLKSGLTSLNGWIRGPLRNAGGLRFTINRRPLSDVTYYPRADVPCEDDSEAIGWSCWVDPEDFRLAAGAAANLEIWHGEYLIGVHYMRLYSAVRNQRPLTYFIHVPKTGGTALRAQFLRHEPLLRTLEVYDDAPGISERQLRSIRPSAFDDYDVIFGHFSFGLHEVIPHRPFSYISMVRDPFDALISNFFFQKDVVKNVDLIGMNIFDFIEQHSQTNDNPTCKMFSGVSATASVDEETFELAKENIDKHFTVIGVDRYLPESAMRMSRLMGVDLRTQLALINSTPRSPERENLDIPKVRNFASTLLRYDLWIYDHVLSRFWGAATSRIDRWPSTGLRWRSLGAEKKALLQPVAKSLSTSRET